MTGVGRAESSSVAVPIKNAEESSRGGRVGHRRRNTWLVGSAVVTVALVWMWPRTVGYALVVGLTEQAPLVLAAMGFALLYRLTGLINMAYAETITFGAYIAVWLSETFDMGFYAVLVPAGVGAGVLSVLTYLAVFRPARLRNIGMLELIIMSLGLSVVLRYGLQLVFGYPVKFFDFAAPSTVSILGVSVASFRIVALFTTLALAVALLLFIQRTRLGLMVRALASDNRLAQSSGVRPMYVQILVWFVAGVAAGLAGAFYGVSSSVSPLLGWREILLIVLVALVGGTWGLRGVILVGIGTGVALAGMSLAFDQTPYADLSLIVVFLAVLKVRGRRLTEGTKV